MAELNDDFQNRFRAALEENDETEIKSMLLSLHYADLADLLERQSTDKRVELIEIIRGELNPGMLTELDDTILEQLAAQVTTDEMASALALLDTDDAVDVVEELPEAEQKVVLEKLPKDSRLLIEESLSFPEDSAGRLMQPRVVSMPLRSSVGEAIDNLRNRHDLPSDFFDIFLVDLENMPVGSVPLGRVMSSKRHIKLENIMMKDMKLVPVTMDQEDVAFIFRQRDLTSAPVVNSHGQLIGVITVDDIVDVIHEEHEEDIMRLAGVGEEDDLYDAVVKTTMSRFSWLFLHLVCAMTAAYVISLFKVQIEQLVVLAVLMPVVATMGGAASVQALTVSVRGIAMKEVNPSNTIRTIGKEAMVGLLNGLIFALMISIISWFWFGSVALGVVIAMAIMINLFVAGLSGSALPILLQKMGYDPAVASSAFLTSITDIVGFYVFLGLGAIVLL